MTRRNVRIGIEDVAAFSIRYQTALNLVTATAQNRSSLSEECLQELCRFKGFVFRSESLPFKGLEIKALDERSIG